MSRVFRITVLAVAFIAGIAASAPAEESTLVFDLAAEGGFVEEHTARLLWNLKTDNIVHDSVSEGWNSLYLEQPEATSGRVVVDLETGFITGEIIQRWACSGDCRTSTNTPSWTTTRDTGWTATVTNGLLEPDGDSWTVTGSVAIKYHTNVTALESPSDCGGSPCYICEEQLCAVAGEAAATATLEGWLDGNTLSLAFADGLEANIADMDFSPLVRTEFFMSRFSITMTAPVLSANSATPPEPASGDNALDDLADGSVIPGLVAGSPPGPAEPGATDHGGEAGQEATGEGGSGGDVQADESAVGGSSEADGGSMPLTLIVILLIVLAVVAGWLFWAVLRRYFKPVYGSLDGQVGSFEATDVVAKRVFHRKGPAPDPLAPTAQPTGDLAGEVKTEHKVAGTAVDGTAIWVPPGTYPAGRAVNGYTPINVSGEIVWLAPNTTITHEGSGGNIAEPAAPVHNIAAW